MPTLHIEFNPTGGTLFEVQYRPVGSVNPYDIIQVNNSPVNIPVPTADPYEYCVKKICEPGNDSVPICGIASYIPPCVTPQFSFASKNGNNITFNYTLQANQVQFDIETTPPAGGSVFVTRYQTSTNISPLTIAIMNMVTGTYRFRMRGVCGPDVNSAVSQWSNYVDIAVVASSCVKPSDIILANAPGMITVDMRWCDLLSYEDRFCNSPSCTYCINAYAISPNNTLTNVKIEYSIDNGATWNVLIANYNGPTFADTIQVNGQTRQYRLVATDAALNVVTSGTLTYTKL